LLQEKVSLCDLTPVIRIGRNPPALWKQTLMLKDVYNLKRCMAFNTGG